MLLKPSVKLNHVSFPKSFVRPSPGHVLRPPPRSSPVIVRAGTGGGVADRPITKPDQDRKVGTTRRRPPIYKVLLHNDNYNSREYVVRVLVKVVDCLSLDEAVNVMQTAHESGISLVTACAQEEAEMYCQGLRNNGLTSTIEPDGCTGGNTEMMSTLAKQKSIEDLVESKRSLRATLRAQLKSMKTKEMDEQSSKICSHVLNFPLFQQARRIGIYIHCSKLNEVNTSWLVAESLNQGKQCFCPRVINKNAHMELLHIESDRDLVEVPPYGIMEPTDHYKENGTQRKNALDVGLDVLLVPGVGFDKFGGRLGRGGGYYDSYISRCKEYSRAYETQPPVLIGLAFDCQVLPDKVPVDPLDQHVDYLVTHEDIYNCKESQTV